MSDELGDPRGFRAAQLQAVLDHAPDAFVSMDRGGRITEWNLQAVQMFGWSREEALGCTVAELIVPPELRRDHERGMARYLQTGETRILNRPVEVEGVARDGRSVPVELTIAAVGSREEPTFNAFLRDISERRAHELALREADAMFRGAFTHASVGMCLATLDDYRWSQVNPALCALLGRSEEQLVGMRFDELTHPDDIEDTLEGVRRLRDGELAVHETETRYLHADGQVVWVSLSVSLLLDAQGAARCFIAQVLDITARKAADEALAASERRLADAQAIGEVGSWECDLATDQVTWSHQLCRMAGLAPGEHPTTLEGFSALVHPEDRAQWVQSVRQTLEVGASESDYRLVRRDGDVRWVHGRRRVIHGSGGRPVLMSATVHDITRRVADEHALRDAEERFRRSFEEAPIGMALVSLEGRWMKVNDSLCEIVGYSQAQLMELRFQDITHPHDLGSDEELVRRTIAGEVATYQIDKRYLHADGRIVWVQLNVSLVRDSARQPMYFISQIQDITERKQSEDRLEEMARRDHLTGVYNRRGFEEELDRQVSGARRYRRSGAVLLLDLDGFKAVNDTFGHKAGDELLCGIARALRERLRKTDILGRLGGDEFAIVLPQASAEQAEAVVATLKNAIIRHSQRFTGERVSVTASIGFEMFDGSADAEEIIAAADAQMYADKRIA